MEPPVPSSISTPADLFAVTRSINALFLSIQNVVSSRVKVLVSLSLFGVIESSSLVSKGAGIAYVIPSPNLPMRKSLYKSESLKMRSLQGSDSQTILLYSIF